MDEDEIIVGYFKSYPSKRLYPCKDPAGDYCLKYKEICKGTGQCVGGSKLCNGKCIHRDHKCDGKY